MIRPLIGITLDYDTTNTYSCYPWYALREHYSGAVEQSGGIPLLLPYSYVSIDAYLDLIDGLLIPGGDKDIPPQYYGSEFYHPETKICEYRTDFDLKITKAAYERKIPFFGICKGHQVLNVIAGGTLIQHIVDYVPQSLKHQQIEPRHLPSHSIEIYENTRLFNIMQTTQIYVNSNHHQAIEKCGENLKISAKAEDGVIEAVESSTDFFCIGVQWHPEYLTTPYDILLFQAFIQAAQEHKQQKIDK